MSSLNNFKHNKNTNDCSFCWFNVVNLLIENLFIYTRWLFNYFSFESSSTIIMYFRLNKTISTNLLNWLSDCTVLLSNNFSRTISFKNSQRNFNWGFCKWEIKFCIFYLNIPDFRKKRKRVLTLAPIFS